MNPTSVARRLEAGWNPNLARKVTPRKPLWMAEAEEDAGMDIVSLMRIERANGDTWTSIAEGLGIDKNTLTYWVIKWKRQGLID